MFIQARKLTFKIIYNRKPLWTALHQEAQQSHCSKIVGALCLFMDGACLTLTDLGIYQVSVPDPQLARIVYFSQKPSKKPFQ